MNTRRRCLAAGATWPALAWVGAARAQAKPPRVIGWLAADTRSGPQDFTQAMAALGWKPGIDHVLEQRFADGHIDRLVALAQEIAAMQPAVIVATPSSAVRAARTAAPSVPIVLLSGDAVATGLVTSLARPGGLITGMSNVSSDMNQKVLQLLVETMPKLQRVGFLADLTSTSHDIVVSAARRAATQLGVEALVADMARPEDIAPAIAGLAKGRAQALVILASAWFAPHFQKIMELALAQRWPVVGVQGGIVRRGGLFIYAPEWLPMVRRSAFYVERILKGAKPGELPIEQPTTFCWNST